MYTETNNFSIRNVILQFLFVALFIFILIWLFPMKSDMKKAISSIDKNKSDSLSIIYDRIFNENLIAMKDAAKDYYTTSRLPGKVGESTKITLRQMLDKKIILPFNDKNGKQCDLDKSYVEITKKDDEFVMKVNLKCGKEENYLISYMGCYDYCSKTICEKKNTTAKIYKKTTVKASQKYYCKVVNGKYYDKLGRVVNKTNYTKSCITKKPTPEKKYYCEIVNGTYYDKLGNKVNLAKYEEDCTIKSEPIPEYRSLYEYKRVIDGKEQYTNWSEWSESVVKPSVNIEVRTKTAKVKKLVAYKTITENDITKPHYTLENVLVGSTTTKTCTSYNMTSTITDYKEEYVGLGKFLSAPKSTTAVRYELVGSSNWYCDKDCTAGTYYIYKIYKRTPITSTSYSCASYSTDTIVYQAQRHVITGYDKKVTKEPVYEYFDRVYYSYRSKTKTPGTIDLKWSTYNDTTLLNSGYNYTGNSKIELVLK